MAPVQTPVKSTISTRPRLWILSPIIFYLVVGYIVLNIGFGLSLIFSSNRASFIVENNVLTPTVWGFVFITLSFFLMLGIVTRRAKIIKSALIAGLTVKFIWWFAFIALAFKVGLVNTIGALAFWFFISMVQMVAVIFYPPSEQEIHNEISKRLIADARNG